MGDRTPNRVDLLEPRAQLERGGVQRDRALIRKGGKGPEGLGKLVTAERPREMSMMSTIDRGPKMKKNHTAFLPIGK